MTRMPSNQSGVVLFIALIFLVLLTIMAVTTFTISKGTLQITGNMAARSLVLQTATQVSDAAMSSNKLVDTPLAVLSDGSTRTNNVAVDINSNDTASSFVAFNTTGQTIIQAQVQNVNCSSAGPTDPNKLNLALARDLACANSAAIHQNCYDVTFSFDTTATDAVTNAVGKVTQGAAVRAQPGPARNICHDPTSGQQYF